MALGLVRPASDSSGSFPSKRSLKYEPWNYDSGNVFNESRFFLRIESWPNPGVRTIATVICGPDVADILESLKRADGSIARSANGGKNVPGGANSDV